MVRIDSFMSKDAVLQLEKGVDALTVKSAKSESSSRPPSPPDGGFAFAVSVPLRWRGLIPPPNYGTVEANTIYRSSYPQDRNMTVVRSLKCRGVLTLVDSEPGLGFQHWILEKRPAQLKVNIATNKDGQVNTTMDSLCHAILFTLNKANHPLYIHCNQGKHRTGCVVGCLRKLQGHPIDEIIDEYKTYAGAKSREGDIALIRMFDPAVVFEFARKHGYMWLVQELMRDEDIVESRKDSQWSWADECDPDAITVAAL